LFCRDFSLDFFGFRILVLEDDAMGAAAGSAIALEIKSSDT
jgi:hypothetical protein